MKRKEISKKVLRISEGVFSSLTDLILWNIFYFIEISPLKHSTNLKKAEWLAYKNLENFNYQSIKRVFQKAEENNWIKKDLTLTKEGREKLRKSTSVYLNRNKWNGNWYLVSYDIPEKRRRDR